MEISMVRGNATNEYSETIADVAGEEKVNFYFPSVHSGSAEAGYPPSAPDPSICFVDPTPEISEGVGSARNYPNPFNPTAKIIYKLSAERRVTVSFNNLLGQTVRIPIDDQSIPAGRYSVSWHGREDSGNFFCNMGLFLPASNR